MATMLGVLTVNFHTAASVTPKSHLTKSTLALNFCFNWGWLNLSLPKWMMQSCKVILTFEYYVDESYGVTIQTKPLWQHFNMRGATWFSAFYKIWLWSLNSWREMVKKGTQLRGERRCLTGYFPVKSSFSESRTMKSRNTWNRFNVFSNCVLILAYHSQNVKTNNCKRRKRLSLWYPLFFFALQFTLQ